MVPSGAPQYTAPMSARRFVALVSLVLASTSAAVAGAMVIERLWWRWIQGAKTGLDTWGSAMGPSISVSSFWLSFPWATITLLLAAFAWDPTQRRFLKAVLIGIVVAEAAAIYWLAYAHGLRPDPMT